jgi:hypothetical protein
VSDEILKIFKTLWTQCPASFEGEFFRFDALRCLPAPVQKPHPPIWIGGHSRAALRRVARFGDGWHPVGATPAAVLAPKQMRELVDELRRLMEAQQRDPGSLTIAYKAPVYDEPPPGERLPFSGTTEQLLDDVRVYAQLGVSELIFDVRSDDVARSLERMERFGSIIATTKSW